MSNVDQPESNTTLAVDPEALRRRTLLAIDDIAGTARTLELLAKSMDEAAVAVLAVTDADELRRVSTHVRTCALAVLGHAGSIAVRAGALDAFADVRDASRA